MGSQTTFHVRGYLGFHLSQCMEFWPSLELKGNLVAFRLAARTWGSSQVSVSETSLLLRCEGKVGIPLELKQGSRPLFEMKWETRGSSLAVQGNSAFLLSCDGYFSEPLKLEKGVKHPFEFPEGTWFCSRGIAGGWGSSCFDGQSHGFSRIMAGSLGFLSSWEWELREPLVLPQGSQAPFQVATVTSGFLSSHCNGIGLILI